MVGVAPLIKDLTFGGLIADKAFNANSIISLAWADSQDRMDQGQDRRSG